MRTSIRINESFEKLIPGLLAIQFTIGKKVLLIDLRMLVTLNFVQNTMQFQRISREGSRVSIYSDTASFVSIQTPEVQLPNSPFVPKLTSHIVRW